MGSDMRGKGGFNNLIMEPGPLVRFSGVGKRFGNGPAILENIFAATGTMTTTIDGASYTQPGNGD